MDKSHMLGPIQLQWVKNLEAHPERKTKDRLGKLTDDRTSYCACCLGEGLLTLYRAKGLPMSDIWQGFDLYDSSGEEGALNCSYEQLGLYYARGEFIDSDGNHTTITFNGHDFDSLIDMNDSGDMSWTDIAAVIRQCPELIFERKV